jgi:hypothetical protein
MNHEKYISTLIESQFPQFYQEDGPNFIAFVKAYYEWMEQVDPEWVGSTVYQSRAIVDNKDIDLTLPEFIKYFKNKYIQALPENIIADKQLLIKHILDLYRSKGSLEAHKLLFRMFFNEDVEVYIPNEFIFKPSDATWYIPQYIEVTSSPFLNQLNDKKIRSSGEATAVVEGYYEKVIKQKTVNVLYLSNIEGDFRNSDLIYCDDIPEMTIDNAPVIIGSLSTITIDNGGYDYEVGDFLNVQGTGVGGIAQVASVRDENGKVKFKLVDGGYGFSLDAIVTVIGGYGAGATFRVGDITNKQVFVVNTDYIKDVKDLPMDIPTEGFMLRVHGATGHFDENEVITSSANVIHFHVIYEDLGINQIGIANGEILSNTSLGISGLTVYNSVESILYITGSDADLENPLIYPEILLKSDQTGSVVRVKAAFPKRTVVGYALNDTAGDFDGIEADDNNVYLYNDEVEPPLGYFIPGSIITGATGNSAIIDYAYNPDDMVAGVKRISDWQEFFPASAGTTNLDSQLEDTLRWVNKIIGKITYLSAINPGVGYSQAPTVTVAEPLIANLLIPDGKGGVWGNDAVVTATAGTANGIVTAIRITDSGFSYSSLENIILESNTNPAAVTGVTVVDRHGIGTGYWQNRKGFISDEMHLIDSYYYQAFSYELISRKMLKTYEEFVKNFTHPVGFMLFGKYQVKSEMLNQNSRPMEFRFFKEEAPPVIDYGDGGYAGDGGGGNYGGGDG